MPLTMKIWFSEAIAPRSLAGASSDRYVGTVAEEQPMPMPSTPRAMTMAVTSPETMQPIVPAMTTPAATMIVYRRPIRSESRPASAAPNIAPTERLAVMAPLVKGVRCQSLASSTRIPAITPRS